MLKIVAGLTLLLFVGACAQGGLAPGTASFDLPADPASLNPLFIHPDAAATEQELARLTFEPFIDLDQSGRSVPALLAEIPTRQNGGVSADGCTIIYRLRPGVMWQDGVKVSAADVLYTLHAILDPRNPVRSLEGYELIDRAWSPNPSTVVFHLKKAWAPAVQTFFSYGASPQFVLPAHILRNQEPLTRAAFNAAPIGDGPYTFVSWARGDRLIYQANPHYWRGEPKIARLNIRIVPDPSTNLTLMGTGEIDFNLLAPSQRAILAQKRGIAFRVVPTSTVAGVAINTMRPPLNNVQIRRALAMSIDRQAISKKITLGLYPVADMAQPQFSWAFDPSIHQPAYNPKQADALLDRAGWKRARDGMRERSGAPLNLVYVQFPESNTGVRVATVIQSELHSRGIAMSIKSISLAQLYLPSARGGALASGKFDLAYIPWPMGADPDDSALLTCHGTSNYMRYCNPQVDGLESQALSATTQSARKRDYSKIARIVAHDVPVLYLFYANYTYAYRSRLHRFYPNAFLPTWNAGAWTLQ
ncbi:MAG: peptide ABC transporter substrate-binding protein [Candidatus Eremiobacteraeota bacterium]|nr:peptide ABC transporter substrate-binding protein [Candidatus Eremiobacteraeota bacterium]